MSKGIITYKEHDVPRFSEKLLELQIKRIRIREHELELKKKQSDYACLLAKQVRQSLKFQTEDAKDLRRQEITKETHVLLLICFAIFMFFAVIITAMFLDKDQLLSDVIQAIGFIFGGGITGYGIGLRNGKSKKEKINLVK